jgi:hypothetical protein
VEAHVRKLSGGGDLKEMLEAAKRMAPSDRMIRLKEKGPAGRAEFLVVVNSDREATDVTFRSGDEALKPLAGALRDAATYPVDVPGDRRVRLPLGIRVTCDAQRGCVGWVAYPYQVTLDK